MFEEQSIITTEPSPIQMPSEKKFPLKKLIIGVSAVVIIAVVILAVFLMKSKNIRSEVVQVEEATEALVIPDTSGSLPSLDSNNQNESSTSTDSLFDLAIEYISFSNFYKKTKSEVEIGFDDYELPLNVKIDVMNYYDISRKINLDPGLEELNQSGFAVIDNPWHSESPDFYSVFGSLDEEQIPLLITSDFLIYYHQNLLKKAFKDIEKNVFYENLWSINKELYTLAKNRYEARLAMIGNINDSMLEGERLEVAFFAVALELLKPDAKQVKAKMTTDGDTFDEIDVRNFYFVVPPYLRADVIREIELIKQGSQQIKSPVLLYTKNYKDFNVPDEYSSNDKLSNFYLTTEWLNSLFPVNYKNDSCVECLLDREDWRISMIAASLISHDFAISSELKNKWARIYKIIAYFKGLRENLNYTHYQDSLTNLFGEDYDIEELFGDRNESSQDNLEKLRNKLLSYNFESIQGAWNKEDASTKNELGLKMLVDYYWPNNYFFDNLVYPQVGDYQDENLQENNITACTIGKTTSRCNGVALDIINLVHPVSNNDYFQENINYVDYDKQSAQLKAQLTDSKAWYTTNYWSTLGIVKTLLEADKNKMPIFTRSSAWNNRLLGAAIGAWINLQLPLEEFSNIQSSRGQGLNDFSRWGENSYVEPNLELMDELIANNEMFIEMLAALRINDNINSVSLNLQNANNNLISLRNIVIKELQGEALTSDDELVIIDFVKQLKIAPSKSKSKELYIESPKAKKDLKEDLSRLKLLVLIHQEGDNKMFSVGPVWNYIEGN